MVETTYKTWWILHLRMARGENLNTEEQAAYEAGLRQLNQEEILNVDVATLRKGRAEVAALEAQNAQLQTRRNTLEAEIAALETALGKRYDTVVLLETVDGFQKGEKGAAVEVYTMPYEAYDIEIVTDEGKTKGLVEAVRPEQIKVVSATSTGVRFASIRIEEEGTCAAVLFSDNTQVRVRAEELYARRG